MCLNRREGIPKGGDGRNKSTEAGKWKNNFGIPLTTSLYIGEGNGNPLWYSCLENPMDGEACRVESMVGYSLWGRRESDTTE